MRVKTLSALVVLMAASANAEVNEQFAQLRDKSEVVASLGSFLEKYIGVCENALTNDCAKNAEAFRNAAAGKKFFMTITDDTANLLRLGDVDRDGFMLNLTPFFSGGQFGLSQGAPLKTDANGNPVMTLLRIPSVLPEDWTPPLMTRQIQAQALRMQVVFTPQGIWTLPKKGGGQIKGVKAKLEAVLVQVGRTGEQIGLWFAKGVR